MTKGKNDPIVNKRTFKGQVFTGKDGTGAGIEVKDTKGVNKNIGIAKVKATHSRYVGVEGKYKNGRLSAKVYGGKEWIFLRPIHVLSWMHPRILSERENILYK